MGLSPTPTRWPAAGELLVPLKADDDVDANAAGASAYFQTVDGVLRLVLPDGSTVNVGPAAAPAPVIAPRAVVAVKSNLPAAPSFTFSEGSVITGATQSAITFKYSLTTSVPVDETNCAVFTTINGGGVLDALVVTFPGGNQIDVQGQQGTIDPGGSLTISSVSFDFFLVLY